MAKYQPTHNPDETEEKEEKELDPDVLEDDDAVIGDPVIPEESLEDPLDTEDEDGLLEEDFLPQDDE